MKTIAILFLAIPVVVVTMWATIFAGAVEAAGEPIVVFVNPANPVDDLSISELRKLYLSDRTHWATGRAVASVMLGPGQPERTAFLKIVCGMSDADLNKYFLQATFTGKSVTPPKEVYSPAAVRAFVYNSPGAIGFLKASDVPAGDTTVKPVKIDGAASRDSGYKLKM